MQKKFVFVSLFALLAVFACNKPDTVGLEVQPESDVINLNYTDTTAIILETQKQDSLRSDENFASQKTFLLGCMKDDVFGTSTASLYALIKPVGTPDLSKARFDSLVLTLAYKDFYGDSLTEQKFQVYEMTEGLVKDSNYYSTQNFTINPTLLGEKNFFPQKRTDSIEIGGTKFAPHIRIPITDVSFCNRVYDYSDNAAFTDYIKGIYIKALPAVGKGGIITFNAVSTVTGMILYYTNDTSATTPETKSVSFPISPDNAYTSTFTQDYLTASSPINFDNAIAGSDKCYLQGMAGPKVKIKFPNLKNFVSDLPKAINKAELVITVVPNSNSDLAVSPRLGLAVINDDGTISNLPDVSQGTSYFGGSLYNGNQYRFNIAHYIQQILYEKRTDYGLSLFAAEYTQYPNRTIIAGQNNTDVSIRMKLQLTFTNLNP